MDSGVPIRKRGTSRLVVGVPQGQEQNISARIETSDGDVIVLREETLAALVQAYMDVFTHPSTNALELQAAVVPSSQSQARSYQLVPGNTSEEELRRELAGATSPSFLEDEDDQTQVRWNTLAAESSQEDDVDEASSGGLSTQTLSQLDQSQSGARIGWQTRDDGPVFGDIPTQHSRPRPRPPRDQQIDTDADSEAATDDLD